MLAHDLIVWTQALLLDGALAKAEPKRLRYRLLHVAARLAFHGRRGRLRLQHDWPWADRTRRRLPEAQGAPSRHRLTSASSPPPPSRPGHRRDHRCPETAQPALPVLPRNHLSPHHQSNTPQPPPLTINDPPTVTLARLLHDPGSYG